MSRPRATTIAGYIAAAPKPGQKHLRAVYAILKSVAPNAKQSLKWRTPVFEERRILFAFAAFKSHLNFMPTASVLRQFAKELRTFKTGKGSIQFPYDKPLPKALIRKVAALRVRELREKDVRWM
jgi:uncharacterized protein YdhG (YjbR/CyaY superfamily)